jgi:hypothetical protein
MPQTLHPVMQAALAPFVMPRVSLEERRAIADIANNVDKAQRWHLDNDAAALRTQIAQQDKGEAA